MIPSALVVGALVASLTFAQDTTTTDWSQAQESVTDWSQPEENTWTQAAAPAQESTDWNTWQPESPAPAAPSPPSPVAPAPAAPAAPSPAAPAEHNPWVGVGSAAVIWHTRYHGILAMSAYGDYKSKCPDFFTAATLQQQYPGNTNQPYEVVDEWSNVGSYNQSGYSVRVPEMNKILMVFKGNYGWQEYNATLIPFLGIGCDETCKVHAGAYEAWQEVKNHTNDMERIKETQQDLVWSATGHGFGGMVAQVAALDLKYRTFAFSVQSFGSPAVFNPATAAVFNGLFQTDASQRTVANDDSVPTMLPLGMGEMNYTFVNTGIHTFGTSPMYGQDFEVCEGWNMDPRCLGGNSEADHYFYFTDLGDCGGHYTDTYDQALNSRLLRSESAAYAATASEPLGEPETAYTTAPEPSTSELPTASANASAIANAAVASAEPSEDSSAQSVGISALAFVALLAFV